MKECADNLGIGLSTLSRFKTQAKRSEDGEPEFIESGHYTNPVEKENARLQRELKDALEALKILKKAISILGNETPRPIVWYTKKAKKEKTSPWPECSNYSASPDLVIMPT